MDMRRLREFTVIADLGNLSKASLRLNLGQPTLSKHVADLEAELGVKLFNRTPTGLTLTPSGEALLQKGRPLLLEYDAMVAEVRRLKQVESRTVSIASFAGYSPGDDLIGLFSGELAAAYPGTQLEVRDLFSLAEPSLDCLRDRKLDFCITSLPRNADLRGLAHRSLFLDSLVAVVRKGHPLSGRRSVTLDEIRHEVVWTDTLPGNQPAVHRFNELFCDNGIPTVPYVSKADHRGGRSSRLNCERGGMDLAFGSMVRGLVPVPLRKTCSILEIEGDPLTFDIELVYRDDPTDQWLGELASLLVATAAGIDPQEYRA